MRQNRPIAILTKFILWVLVNILVVMGVMVLLFTYVPILNLEIAYQIKSIIKKKEEQPVVITKERVIVVYYEENLYVYMVFEKEIVPGVNTKTKPLDVEYR